jgi:hypothetical protein
MGIVHLYVYEDHKAIKYNCNKEGISIKWIWKFIHKKD